jgi:hypothetical protein
MLQLKFPTQRVATSSLCDWFVRYSVITHWTKKRKKKEKKKKTWHWGSALLK